MLISRKNKFFLTRKVMWWYLFD